MKFFVFLFLAAGLFFPEAQGVESILFQTVQDTVKTEYTVGRVPDVSKEVVLDSILANYKGKVVFVDMWFVYCRSCLRAMEEMKELKKEFEKKGVEFVFITGAKASPINYWQKMIPNIGGNHYRVTNEIYRYLIDERFKMNGLPYYMIVNKKGEIKYTYCGFMGCEKMREILEKELKEK